MDRISALRNVEDALADFEDGEATLDDVEDRVVGVLRTYATEFESGDASAYRATGAAEVEGVVVVAESPEAAEERIAERVDGRVPEFGVEPLD
jgi:stress response protein YsnF